MMKRSIQSVLLAFVFLTVLLSGCATAATPVPATPTLLPPTATLVPATPTMAPTPTLVPTATVQSTVGTIEGRVFQSDTNRAFGGATVSLDNADLDPNDPARKVATATTDAKGNYVFDNVAPGNYTLVVTVWIQKEADMPCSIMIMQGTVDQQWLMVTIRTADGKQAILATQTHVEDNSWVPTVFDVAAGDLVQMDADLRCK